MPLFVTNKVGKLKELRDLQQNFLDIASDQATDVTWSLAPFLIMI